jgi:hypothetical protein
MPGAVEVVSTREPPSVRYGACVRRTGMTSRLIGAGLIACLATAGIADGGQSRYEAFDRSEITGAPGLRVVNVRDNALKTCYAVFIVGATDPAVSSDRIELSELRNAVAARDQRLAELLAAYEQALGAIPGTLAPIPFRYEWQADTAQVEFALAGLSNMFARLEADLLRASRTAMTVVPQACVPAERPPR